MASAFSHAAAALALGAAFRPSLPAAGWPSGNPASPSRLPVRFWLLAIACATVPDLDSIGFAFGIRYGDLLGHRGLSHSLPFAAALGAATALLGFRGPAWKAHRLRLSLCFFLCAASHGLLDALTNGGLGVAFFSPFDPARHFLPFQPIQVSPINIRRFFEGAGWAVMASELKWVWLPSAVFAACATAVRRRVRVDVG